VARALQRAGRWDEALAVLPAGELAARAELLADRFWWRLDDPAEAESAIRERARTPTSCVRRRASPPASLG
jgi:hypothetical protein